GYRHAISTRSASSTSSPARPISYASDSSGLLLLGRFGYARRLRPDDLAAEPVRSSSREGLVQPQSSNSLSAEKLQLLVARLSGLAPDEVRKAKLLYIRNAISEYQATQAVLQGFRQAQGCMSIVPVFWPIIGAQKRMMAAQLELARGRIRNAIDVWREDLKG